MTETWILNTKTLDDGPPVELSEIQKVALAALCDASDSSLRVVPAYGGIVVASDLQTEPKARTTKVLDSLCDFGLATKEQKTSRFGFEKPGFYWKITPTGRKWLAQQDAETNLNPNGP